MHPAAVLLAWLAVVLTVQFSSYTALLLVLAASLVQPGVAAFAWRQVWRMRWLLLMLWAIVAYHTPGEAWRDLDWAPTYEGIALAMLHTLRLLCLLACLAWLFVRQGRDGIVAGLYALLLPLKLSGSGGERLIVRLALVLEQMQTPPEAGAWRRVLMAGEPERAPGNEFMRIDAAPWRTVDTVLLLVVTGVALGLMGLP